MTQKALDISHASMKMREEKQRQQAEKEESSVEEYRRLKELRLNQAKANSEKVAHDRDEFEQVATARMAEKKRHAPGRWPSALPRTSAMPSLKRREGINRLRSG